MKPKIFIARGISSKKLLELVFDEYHIEDRRLRYGSHGKPYLVSGDLYFNLSHSEDMTVCAVSDKEIGVDVQKIDFRKRVISKVCNEQEARSIKTPEDFTRMWVLKESFSKCDGRGYSYGFRNIDTNCLKGSEVWRVGDFFVAACYNTR